MSKADRNVSPQGPRRTSQVFFSRMSGPLCVVLLGALLGPCLSAPTPALLAQESRSPYLADDGFHSPFAVVAERVMPAVVAIRTIRSAEGDSELQDMFREYFRGDPNFQHPDFDTPGAGSGFVVSADGLVITNNHVIASADEIYVKLPSYPEALEARVVGTDPATDLAVIQIDPPEQLAYLVFGSSEEIRVGDWAIAIGNPLGELEGSLTVGVISAKGRTNLAIQGAELRYQDFLQTDAAINPGNSGGPLLNIRGEVIGVNTAINRAGQGIGFAIPARLTSYIYAQLVEFGRVRRGYLGIQMVELADERMRGEEIDAEYGVLVTEVLSATPASEGGILIGDVLMEYNGEPVMSIPDLRFRVAESEVGSTANLGILRDGQRLDLDVVLAEYDESQVAARIPDVVPRSEENWLGLIARPIDSPDPRAERLRDEFDIQDGEGVLVVGVVEGSPADEARILPGDIIVEIGNQEVRSMADYVQIRLTEQAVDAVEREAGGESSSRSIAFLVRRGDMSSYFQIDPAPALDTPPRNP